MNNDNYTPDKQQFMLNFMYDLSHMAEDRDISPEERLEQYSDYKHLKSLRRESIRSSMIAWAMGTSAQGIAIANAAALDDHLRPNHDEELGTRASSKVSIGPIEAADEEYEQFVSSLAATFDKVCGTNRS